MKKKFLSLVVSFWVCVLPISIFASGYPVFDASNLIASIDQVYNSYQQITHTITQIENQYKQIQKAVEAAKTIDWENIRFDGDFDIRNELSDATSRVNSLLNQAKTINEAITNPSINCGGVQYSIADLCGASTSNVREGRKNLLTAIADYKSFLTDTMKSAVNGVVKDLTPQQKKAISTKYGIPAENYVYIHEAQTQVMEQVAKTMAKAEDTAKEMFLTEKVTRANNIVKSAFDNKDSDGNPTVAGMQQSQLLLTQEMLAILAELGISMNDLAKLSAAKMMQEDAETIAEINGNAEAAELQNFKDNKTSSRFFVEE